MGIFGAVALASVLVSGIAAAARHLHLATYGSPSS